MRADVSAPSTFIVAALVSVFSIGAALDAQAEPAAKSPPAQRPPKAATPAPTSAAPTPPPPAQEAKPQNAGGQNVLGGRWTSRCSSEGRSATLDCVVEQNAVVTFAKARDDHG